MKISTFKASECAMIFLSLVFCPAVGIGQQDADVQTPKLLEQDHSCAEASAGSSCTPTGDKSSPTSQPQPQTLYSIFPVPRDRGTDQGCVPSNTELPFTVSPPEALSWAGRECPSPENAGRTSPPATTIPTLMLPEILPVKVQSTSLLNVLSAYPIPEAAPPDSPVSAPPAERVLIGTSIVAPVVRPAGEDILAVIINGVPMGDFVPMYHDARGRWFATAELLAQARLTRSASPSVRINSTDYFPLDAYLGAVYRFEATQQMLYVNVKPDDVQLRMIQASKRIPTTPMTSDPGFFVNHDFQVTGSGSTAEVGGIEEFGFFSKLGVLNSQFVARDLTRHLSATRLDSQFTRDFPQKMVTLGLGDGYSASFAAWSQTVHYTGIRLASNFSTQPGFLPFALPSIAGSADQPSTLDLYVNGLQTMHQSLDEGPFAINDIPVMSAVGEIQMVVTDVLGRQQILSRPYISTRMLLRKNVKEYAFESGVQRRSFGMRSDAYGGWFADANYRHGLSNSFTLNLRGELLRDCQTLAAGFDHGIPRFGVFSAGIASTHQNNGKSGGLAYAEFDHSARSLGLSLYAQAAQPNFRQLGHEPAEKTTQLLGQSEVSLALGKWVTASGGAMHMEKPTNTYFDRFSHPVPRFSTVTSSLNIRLPHGAALVLSANYTPEFHQKVSGILSLVIPFNKNRVVVANVESNSGVISPSVEYNQQLPTGAGFGYRLRTATNNGFRSPRVDAGVSYQNGLGTHSLEFGQRAGSPINWRYSYQGGAVFLNGDALLSRQLNQSFAVIDAAGAPGVNVLANNNFVARTDRRGLAIVPSLPAYNLNTIALDDSSAPLDREIDLAERTIVPMARSGLLVKFNAEKISSALIDLVTETGDEVPVGAHVTVEGNAGSFQVALHGEVYVPTIQSQATLRVSWDGVTCQATVSAPQSKEPLPRIGPVQCRRIP